MGSSIVAAGRTLHFKTVFLTRARPALQQFRACFCRPLSNSITKLARPRRWAVRAVALEEEKLPGRESANGSGAGSQQLIGRSQTIDVKPGWPTDNVQHGRQKTCTKCQYPKLLVDFKETEVTVDKRQDVCRACMATISAMWNGKELHHLRLTPAEAWSRAKACAWCRFVKEIRSFAHKSGAKDRTDRWCRSCRSMHDKARPAKLPVDTPQRCKRCHELKPAREFRVSPKAPNGLHPNCEDCALVLERERCAKLKEIPKQLPEKQSKVCTACGELRKASEFYKLKRSSDNLSCVCKPCRSARDKEAYQARKERGAVEAGAISSRTNLARVSWVGPKIAPEIKRSCYQ